MFTNIYDILIQKNLVYENKIAVIDNQKKYTYSEMKMHIELIFCGKRD